ncbi:right-handed parallel beta-helix repeat-containing protein [Nostoc sp. UCD121]|nr:right-handed parallel beta-helix repeat-containing protein [Nostoc sp. UCD120]MBC1280766.1 right-handed parallel beta-helix repeat-containing protein [Nostoc sp. UCD121]MBC1298903.1 right-handed parallel beta-helix repeat-containing protein [Nostoc sp. UCD122]
MIHGLGFLSLSASLVLPWALTGLVQGQRITESLVKDVRQLSTDQNISLPSRKLISQVSTATKYYVSGSGNDKNNGLSPSSAFRTIQRAADLTRPGDTVLILNGVYKNPSPNGSALVIKRSGTANSWITYKAYPGDKPKIQHNGWTGISIENGASYIEINGLEVAGNNANITLSYALSQKYNKSNPLTSGTCINMDGRKSGRSHHIRILNNKVHDCGGAGISVIESDYVTVDNNEVYNNAWYSPYAASGISLLKNWNYDKNQNYKMYVTRNKVYNNQMLVPWYANGKFQDGNGIIVDSSRSNGYQGRTLIANNISYKNGGSGIHTYESDYVDIVHNTAYLNNQTAGINYGQIMSNYSGNIKVINNALYSAPNKPISSNNKSTNTTFNYNLYNNNGSRSVSVGPNDIMADPQFVNPSGGDFRIKGTSRAINNGFKWNNLKNDYFGKPRPVGAGYDIGAHEYQ